jgi:GT2 family glycosyltransferase
MRGRLLAKITSRTRSRFLQTNSDPRFYFISVRDPMTRGEDVADGHLAIGSCDTAVLRPVVVAIPVRNEVNRIESCLTAIAAQSKPPDSAVLLFNNCDDGSELEAKRMSRHLPFSLEMVSVQLASDQANAGTARRLAMRHASNIAGNHGALLTTDADAVVSDDWVYRNLAALVAGADAVCGRAVIDPVEALAIPAHLHADDQLESELLDLLDEIAFALDPEPHDPRPRHVQASGASLAVSNDMFRRVGGVPKVASGEDRALVHALRLKDARIRHDAAMEVVASGRLDGRAPGGMADTIRRRILQQDEYADDLVEPAADAWRRADFRRRLRAAWHERSFPGELAADLRFAPSRLSRILSETYFGAAWDQVQRESPVLLRRRLRFVDLPRQIELARELLGGNCGAGEQTSWRRTLTGPLVP